MVLVNILVVLFMYFFVYFFVYFLNLLNGGEIMADFAYEFWERVDDLKGKDVIGGRAGGMPEMTFEWALKEHNIDPKKDVNIDTSIAFAAMSSAFIGGQGDFVTLFDDSVIKRKSSTLNFLSVLLLS